MPNDPLSDIDAAFDKRDVRIAAQQDADKRASDERAVRMEKFKGIQENIIRPAMEGVGAKLESRGWKYRIDTDNGSGLKDRLRIGFLFGPDGFPLRINSGQMIPQLAFAYDGRSSSVHIHKTVATAGGGGSSGGDGAVELDQITTEYVTERLVKLAVEVVK